MTKGAVVPRNHTLRSHPVGPVTGSPCCPSDSQRSQPKPLGAIVGDHHDILIIQIRGVVRHLHHARRRCRIRRFTGRQTDWQQLDFVTDNGGQCCPRWRESQVGYGGSFDIPSDHIALP